ncbi:LacI family transcriptional regulator [Thiospirochaeta perfilievii]|uniref:LacI family transcriptional regulator n=1 Tax=Thiospirochaeta perfilievii TaxID=252967 RepID=A0A5C1QBR5_9SPIO|nr:LacI family DNA-binding transcriptional regulator [Thiospirochaeta perfilievii]QEN04309.1 LacI family transcriptional regulator [Thiospirochaeta perfilievii]
MNIYEIAKKAGVSTATVSRVINNSPKVSEKTRAKINKLMEEENYIPSAFARGLSGSSVKSIGILTIDIRDQYFASVIHSLEQELSLHKYNVILCNTGGESDTQRNYISLLMQKKIDILILVGSVFKYDELKEVIKSVSIKVPVIIVNESVEGDNIYSIVSNEGEGIEKLVLYLKELGHREFVYIKTSDSYSAKRKVKGFRNSTDNSAILIGENSLDSTAVLANKILDLEIRPSAIVCDEDITALGIIQQLTKRGFSIPIDFTVTGFNNLIFSQCSNPLITTIDSKSSAMGLSAARLALDILEKRNVPTLSTINTKLIIRESSSVNTRGV